MKGQWIQYSDAEKAWIQSNRKLNRTELHKQFCEKFQRTDVNKDNLKSLCTRNGWLTGRDGKFKKGQKPHPNAGTKGPNSTSFKPGNRPKNWRPVGAKRTTVDGYIEIKTADPNQWESLHTVLWQQAHGKIPENHVVAFKNGDKTDIRLENLELLTRAENMCINKLKTSEYSGEARDATRTLGKLIAKTKEVQASKPAMTHINKTHNIF